MKDEPHAAHNERLAVTDTRTETQMNRLRERTQNLERKVVALESLLLRGILTLIIALVSIGSLRAAVHNPDGAVERWSLLTAPFRYLHYLRNDVPREDVVVTLVVVAAATVLLLAVAMALGICLRLWGRDVSERTLALAGVVSVVLGVGALVVLLIGLVVQVRVDEASVGAGTWWLLAGSGLFALLSYQGDLRALCFR